MLRTLAAVTVCLASAVATPAARQPQARLDGHWELFKTAHGKSYSNANEELPRRLIWEDHVALIARHNREYDLGLKTFTLGLNRFADMTNEEFVSVFNGYKHLGKSGEGKRSAFVAPNNVLLPDAVDWRALGYVTRVKDQGQCGACWAFSASGSLEGQHFKATGQLVSLSEQNLIDCSGAEGNEGCYGGMMYNAFMYVKKNGGIDTESSYPYMARDGKCNFSKADIGATDTGFVSTTMGNETDLQVAVATVGPVSVTIDASHTSFQLYQSGIYDEMECSTTRLDRAMLVVGYGTTGGKDFWIVKNWFAFRCLSPLTALTWSTSWGEQGYIRMSRNLKNQCGIATAASYPLV